ncbi:MAG: hypothetical protein WCK48_01745 [bacterium]
MKYIKFSFYYISAYLGLAGITFLFIPAQFQKLLFASEIYDPIPMAIAGMFALLLSIVLFQLARKGLFELYPTTFFARIVAIAIIVSLYVRTHNPFFISMFMIVIVGMIITAIGHFKMKEVK